MPWLPMPLSLKPSAVKQSGHQNELLYALRERRIDVRM